MGEGLPDVNPRVDSSNGRAIQSARMKRHRPMAGRVAAQTGPRSRARVATRTDPRRSAADIPIGVILRGLQRTAPRWRPTALAVVADQTRDPFRVLVACLLSLRTQDTTTGPAAGRLFALADTPRTMLELTPRQIERAIYPVGFYRTKARVILRLCRDLLDRFGGRVPDDLDTLLTLDGVGRKTANLVVTMGFGKPGICVDTHVHRISNRLGYVRTRTPEETEMALRAKLPRPYWIGYNDLLVAFGQNVCTPISPRCSVCPVRERCRRVGVTGSR
jgi:endonuclease III